MRTLKKARALLGSTQEQLANYVGMTAQQVRNIESGRCRPRPITRQKFEKMLGEIDWQETWREGSLNQN